MGGMCKERWVENRQKNTVVKYKLLMYMKFDNTE